MLAVAFRTGSRDNDLAKLLVAQVLQFLSSQGLELNFQLTKTLRDGAKHASLLLIATDRHDTWCAAAAMIRYEQVADSCEWDMFTGYIFPEMPDSGHRTPKRLARPLSGKAMVARFENYMEYAGLGTRHLTFRSFRVGCAVTQTIAGKDIAENMAAIN